MAATDTQQINLNAFLAGLKPEDRALVTGSGDIDQVHHIIYGNVENLNLSTADAGRLYEEALKTYPYLSTPQASQQPQERHEGAGEGERELAGGLIEAVVNRKSEEDKLLFEMKQEQTEKLLQEIDTKFGNKTINTEDLRSFLNKLESDNLLGDNITSLKQRIETVGNATNVGTTQITKQLEDRFTEQKEKRTIEHDDNVKEEKAKGKTYKAIDELDYENLIKQLSDEKLSPEERKIFLHGLLARQQGFAFQRLEDILTLKRANFLGIGRVSLISKRFAKLTRKRIQEERKETIRKRRQERDIQPTEPIQLIAPEITITQSEEPQQAYYSPEQENRSSSVGSSNGGINLRKTEQNIKRISNAIKKLSNVAKAASGAGEAVGATIAGAPVIVVVLIVIVALAIISLIFILVLNGWQQQLQQQQTGVPIPGLHLNLTTNPPGITSYQNGQNVSFVVDVTYQGTYSVLVTDAIPQNANVIPNSISGKNNSSNNSVTWSLDANPPLPDSTSTIRHWQFTLSFTPTGKDLLLTNDVTASYAPGSGPTAQTAGGRYGYVQTHDVTGGVCSPTNLAKYFGNIQAGTIASCICKHESGGDPGQKNLSCTSPNGGPDYSIGLFQINLVAHCPGALNYNSGSEKCSVNGPTGDRLLNTCVRDYISEDGNIKEAVALWHAAHENWDVHWHAESKAILKDKSCF